MNALARLRLTLRVLADVQQACDADAARDLIDAALVGMDADRRRAGLDVLGYGTRPTLAELRASWRALDPDNAPRRRRWRSAA